MSDENWTGSLGTDSHLRLGSGANSVILEAFASQLAVRLPGSSSRTTFTPLYGGTNVAAPTGVQATDAAAIATAIAAAGANGLVNFQNGTYVADNLTPLNGQTWLGNRTTIKRPNGSTLSIITGSGITDFTLQSMIIDGNRSSATATSNGCYRMINSTRPRVLDCTFQNAPLNNGAIEYHGASDGIISRNRITNVGYGITVGLLIGETFACTNNVISENVIDTTDLNAVFFTENLASNFTSTTIAAGSNGAALPQATINVAATAGMPTSGKVRIGGIDGAIVTYTGVTGTTLTGCTGGTGTLSTSETVNIYVVGNVIGTVFTGNTVSNFGDCGIESGTGTVGTVISGNTFIGNANSNQSILFRDALHCNATGNVCQGSSKSGGCGINVWFGNYFSIDSTLANNTCTGNGFNGIYGQNVYDITIAGGSCSNNTTDGIRLDNVRGFTITGTTVAYNGQQGISVGVFSTTSSIDGVVTGCHVKNNSQTTPGNSSGIILFNSSTGVVISDNRVNDSQATKTQGYGIRIFSAAVSATIQDNDVTGNLTQAIFNDGASLTLSQYRNRGAVSQGPDYLSNGELSLSTEVTGDSNSFSATPASGTVLVKYFQAKNSWSGMKFINVQTMGTAPSGLTLVKVALFSAAANGDLTRLDISADVHTTFTGTFTNFKIPLTAQTANLVEGSIYAIGLIQVGTTPGSLLGASGETIGSISQTGVFWRTGRLLAQSDIPATITAASMTYSWQLFGAVTTS